MLKKRIIPCLDIKDGKTVKGIKFNRLINVGDPIQLAKIYTKENADELVFLDINATLENRVTFTNLVKKIAKKINIPFTVGGGVSSIENAKLLINSGADKISINSSAISNPKLITQIAKEFGSQSVVLAIDTNFVNNQWKVFSHGGKRETKLSTLDWIKQVEDLGAGEILLTSMKHDGTKQGFSINLLKQVCEIVNLPIIASGGAGKMEHFSELFSKTKVTGALAASIFHYNELSIKNLKKYLINKKISIRK